MSLHYADHHFIAIPKRHHWRRVKLHWLYSCNNLPITVDIFVCYLQFDTLSRRYVGNRYTLITMHGRNEETHVYRCGWLLSTILSTLLSSICNNDDTYEVACGNRFRYPGYKRTVAMEKKKKKTGWKWYTRIAVLYFPYEWRRCILDGGEKTSGKLYNLCLEQYGVAIR